MNSHMLRFIITEKVIVINPWLCCSCLYSALLQVFHNRLTTLDQSLYMHFHNSKVTASTKGNTTFFAEYILYTVDLLTSKPVLISEKRIIQG